MASSIETTSTTTTLKNNGNTYLSVDTNDDVAITNTLTATSPTFVTPNIGAATVTSLNGGQLAGNRNKIINGDMKIDQRNAGASLTITANPQYTLDRWFAGVSVGSKISVQQSSTAPAGFTKSLLVTSLAATTPASSELYYMQQSIEGYNVSDLDFGLSTAKTITISFWTRSSLTGAFGAVLLNAGSNRSFPFNYTISVADTWTQVTQTITGDTTGTWATDNSVGFQLRVGLGAGATFQGTAGAWGTTNAVTTTTATSLVGTSGATLYIAGVQLEEGSVATPFEHRSYGTELALCQRYFEGAVYWQTEGDLASTGTALSNRAYYKVTKRATPTVSNFTLIASSNFNAASLLNTLPDANGISIYGNPTATGHLFVYYTFDASAEL